ncbi:DUF4199 family protein [Daejeonella lutea]|uniref:DUF4199 domain-containing protein n=1 Tax=Daejeonella lutea TaxID=572036 RepID=A0A1T5DN88_9SPHI|nr:DUF4199 family protein [Daejeonella lutea]SKB73071.1 Protein of unknown function [Daejeonella lutea]
MGNAAKYGIIIGVLSGIWILVMHFAGVYAKDATTGTTSMEWMEWASMLIPAIGLYLGIKSYRDHISGGKMEFFEGLFEGFKIIIIGGVIAAFFAIVYVQLNISVLNTDYMYRISAAVLIGILFNLAISLMLMNKQKHL